MQAPTVSGVRRALRDPDLERTMAAQGYVVVPLLAADEIARLRALFERTHPQPAEGFATDFERLDPASRVLVEEEAAPLWAEHLPGLLDDYRIFMTSFLAKWPGQGSGLSLHQDWTYIDERRGRSVAFWVALDDVGPAIGNGPLCVVPGSHLLADTYRGPATEQWFSPWLDELARAAVPLTVPAGHAVLIDARLIHWSPPNGSGRLRLALAGAAVPREAPLLFVVDEPDDQVRVVAADDALFATSSPAELAVAALPDRTVVAHSRRVLRPVDVGELAVALGRPVAAPPGEGLGDTRPPALVGAIERVVGAPMRVAHTVVQQVDPTAGQPFPPTSTFEWIPALEASWQAIRDEYRNLLDAGLRVPSMEAVADAAMPNEGRWLAFVLRTNAGWIDDNAERLPVLASMLRTIPGLRAALVSSLGPWARLAPHRGPNKGVLRVHLGLVVPGPPGRAILRAGDQVAAYEEGRCLVFDDTFEHAVENRADSMRVTLMLEVDRPLPGHAARANRVLQHTFRWFPQVRGAAERLADLDRALNH